ALGLPDLVVARHLRRRHCGGGSRKSLFASVFFWGVSFVLSPPALGGSGFLCVCGGPPMNTYPLLHLHNPLGLCDKSQHAPLTSRDAGLPYHRSFASMDRRALRYNCVI